MDEDGCGCISTIIIAAIIVGIIWWAMSGPGPEPGFRPTTTTTAPNQDPTKGWVYDNGISFRCEGPNMVFQGDGVTSSSDPRCQAALTTTTTGYVPR